MQIFGAIAALLLLSVAETYAFQSTTSLRPGGLATLFAASESKTVTTLQASVVEPPEHREKRIQTTYQLSDAEIKPIIRLSKGEKEKVINAFGIGTIIITVVTLPVWVLAMTIVNFINKNINSEWDPNRAIYDKTGKIWSKVWLSMANSYPTSSGEVDFLKEGGKCPCLFVANHASWLDIPVLCTVLDPVFKFIAKGELTKIPGVGQQLVGGDHILIDRDDRKSQLRTFKEGISWLRKGVPLMAFPEGRRSPDGRLVDFKGGLFSMAVKTGVPIVPLTISHTYSIMPSNALFPVQHGRGKLHVHVHPPIESTGRTDAELAELVREAFLSELPLDHLPLDTLETQVIEALASENALQVNGASHSSVSVVDPQHHHMAPSSLHHVPSKDDHLSVVEHPPQNFAPSLRHVSSHNDHHIPSRPQHQHDAQLHHENNLPLYAVEVTKEKLVNKQ